MALERILVGKAVDLPPGTRKMIPTELENILVVNVMGQYYAVSNTCPHAGGYLNFGPMDGYILECPLHYWPFDVRTGQLVGLEGLLDEELNTYPVEVVDDNVYIILDF